MNWKNIKHPGISSIEKLVAEFQVWFVEDLPYAKVKVRIYEDSDGNFTGFTNIQIKSPFDGAPEAAAGFGKTIDEALSDTIRYFATLISQKGGNLTEADIEYVDPDDF
jgi:hypothetical protein